jgi:hypothetical protein
MRLSLQNMSGVRLQVAVSAAVWAILERRDGWGVSIRREAPVEWLIEVFLSPGIVGSIGF